MLPGSAEVPARYAWDLPRTGTLRSVREITACASLSTLRSSARAWAAPGAQPGLPRGVTVEG
jgi:hypothetical protein